MVALLESGDYETSKDLAKAIIHTLVDELAKRDAYGISRGLGSDDLRIAHGPYWDRRDAEKALKASQEAGLVARGWRLAGPLLPEPERAPVARCEACAHATQFHDARGCWAMDGSKVQCACRSLP